MRVIEVFLYINIMMLPQASTAIIIFQKDSPSFLRSSTFQSSWNSCHNLCTNKKFKLLIKFLIKLRREIVRSPKAWEFGESVGGGMRLLIKLDLLCFAYKFVFAMFLRHAGLHMLKIWTVLFTSGTLGSSIWNPYTPMKDIFSYNLNFSNREVLHTLSIFIHVQKF